MKFLLVVAFVVLACINRNGIAETYSSNSAVVATVQPLATDAAVQTLKSGGNAVDAAIAAALTLGVVDGHNSGIGGGCFILIRQANGKILAIDGREMAPAKATRDMYVRNGKVDPELSQQGALAVGVPGALAAYEKAVQMAGKKSLADLLTPAAKIAADGFPIDRILASRIKSKASQLAKFPASKKVYLFKNGLAPEPNDRLVQSDLANTYRSVAKHGTKWFYEGPFAESIGRWMRQNGGILTAADMANYRVVLRKPIVTKYRDYEICGFPPPSSGGIHVAQILNILENFDLREIDKKNPVDRIHLVTEAMKLAFADRAHWLGDADFAKVPKGLIAKQYAAKLAQQIKLHQPLNVASHGLPEGWESDLFGKHTTHIAAADQEGNWVAITATVNTSFGSKVIVPGTGVVLNNEMDDFSAQPGTPNAFGLLGAENNAIAPGKRPLSSMSPTIVLKDGQPMVTLGAAGGPRIITSVLLTLVRLLDLDMPLEEAVAGARFHHQWRPDRLFVENKFSMEFEKQLKTRGHPVTRLPSTGGVLQAIMKMDNGTLRAVHDPRIPGKAAGL